MNARQLIKAVHLMKQSSAGSHRLITRAVLLSGATGYGVAVSQFLLWRRFDGSHAEHVLPLRTYHVHAHSMRRFYALSAELQGAPYTLLEIDKAISDARALTLLNRWYALTDSRRKVTRP